MEFQKLRISEIQTGNTAPKWTYLLKSLKTAGMLQPVVVTKDNGSYRVVAGERRLRAAVKAGLEEVPALLLDESEGLNAELVILTENLVRRRNLAKEAEAVKKLIDSGLTFEAVHKSTGVPLSELKKLYHLACHLIPELFDRLRQGQISGSTAVRLSQLPPSVQKEFAELGKITLEMVEERLRKQKKAFSVQALESLQGMFHELDREIEIQRIRESIRRFNITKEELFGPEVS
ncbi:MAG: ParB/RepB/Spo0J family partition protein [Thermofilum sp.]